MPNTALRTNIQAGETGQVADTNIVHAEVNELSRSTGLRDIGGLLINGWELSTGTSALHIERVRDHVYLYIRGLDGTNATSSDFLQFTDNGSDPFLGPEWSPRNSSFQSSMHCDDQGSPWIIRANQATVWVPNLPSLDDYHRFLGGYWRTITWRTWPNQTWPDVLPGTPWP